MRVCHVSTYDKRGGAGRAALRLHKGAALLGEDSRLLVRFKTVEDPTISAVCDNRGDCGNGFDGLNAEGFFLQKVVQENYINANRTDLSDTLFSLPYPGYDLTGLEAIRRADVINLHWVAFFQSPMTLSALFSMGKPVVWTLHDMGPFTGGCHYSAGCDGYCRDCMNCPQLLDDPHNLPAAVLKDKLESFQTPNLTIVTPSRWMANCAGQSRLFKDRRIEVIPNGLATEGIDPTSKSEAKHALGIDPDTITLSFGVENGSEKRKGFHKLVEAIRYCAKDARMRDLIQGQKIRLICFGHAHPRIEETGIPVTALGYLDSEADVVTAYCASDLYLQPSLEDNFPNTILESMGCATPVLAFDVGGISEIISHDINGRLSPAGDSRHMGESIISLSLSADRRQQMGEKARQRIEAAYTSRGQAESYRDLYQELTGQERTKDAFDGHAAEEKPLTGAPTAACSHAVGPHTQAIYDKILYQSLRRFALDTFQRLNESENDRAARKEQIDRLTRLAKRYENDNRLRQDQIDELTERLKACEKKKAARQTQIDELHSLLETCESDRRARLDQIHDLEALLRECESDRAARLENMHALEGLINRLSGEIEQMGSELRLTRDILDQLEHTFIVQKARKLGLIKVGRPHEDKKHLSDKGPDVSE